MTADTSGLTTGRDGSAGDLVIHSDIDAWRTFVIAAGLCWSGLFVVIGLRYELQLYADGSIFSYSVAVQDAWAFHWHNISDRLFVYLFSYVPSELYVELTRDARGGIAVYGLLFFAAPLLGLVATFAADRSKSCIIFGYACFSTACLCPLIFGFPTEIWMAHALFWPTLAACHYVRTGIGGAALVFAMLLALVFTHEGALIFAVAILATLLLRGRRDVAFLRAGGAFFVVISVWTIVKITFPPDAYIAVFLTRAALHVFNVGILTDHLILLLFGALAIYATGFCALRRLGTANAHVYAALIVAAALVVYWLWFDHTLHSDNRYYLRTVVIVSTPMIGALAMVYALSADGRLALPLPLVAALTSGAIARAGAGALALVLLVHAVETAKFVTAWSHYKRAVQTLAMGGSSDPALGDPHFVSSHRIGSALNRLSWFSTTHFLSVLVAPKFAPARLVVDPDANFFWLSCKTATANLEADRVVPAESRRLVRTYSCLHR
jgi:hypothetical protein